MLLAHKGSQCRSASHRAGWCLRSVYAKHRRLPVFSIICIALLLTAADVGAQESCVQLRAALPRDLERCVSAQQLCQSYQEAAAANGGLGETLPVQQWEVLLRGHAAGSSGELTIELDAVADGRALGQRTLAVRRSDCAALPDALAWVLLLLAQDAVSSPPSPPIVQVVEDIEPLPPSAAVAPPQASLGALELGAGAGIWLGALPSSAFALQLQAAVPSEPIAYRMRVTFLWPQQLDIAEGSVLMRDYELTIEACPGLQLQTQPRLALRACAGPRFGLVYARAQNFALQNDQTTQFLLYFGVVPEASLALGPTTWLQLNAGAAVGLVRPRIAVAFGDGQSRTVLSALRWLRAELMLSLVQIF